jgi:branched-chain amino acid transport system substrate-binding protein
LKPIASILWAAALCVMASSVRAQISDDVVRLGVLTDMNGPSADGAGKGSFIAAQLAAEDFGGKVAGKPIDVISGDHQNKVDTGLGLARRWYDIDGVDVILDVPVSSIALAVQQITKEKNKVFLMGASGSSELTGAACSPNGIQWIYNTYALASVAARALLRRGDDSWFFVTADYTFGHTLERDTSAIIAEAGGKVLGSAKHPFNFSDFSSQLLTAQASKAKVIALADSGQDTQNVIKQAAEFGLMKGGQKLLALLFGITDVYGVGLEQAQGMLLTDAFYWDQDEKSRAFARRFEARIGRKPTMMQAGVYSAATHYLKAVEAAKTDDAQTVLAQMRKMPVNDIFARNGHIREDGQMVHDMYLVEVKTPAESKEPWDLYKILETVPGDKAFQPIEKSACPLVRK